jgi:hypothetical protein
MVVRILLNDSRKVATDIAALVESMSFQVTSQSLLSLAEYGAFVTVLQP